MREILFRGKEITTAKWVYGGYYGDSKRAWIRSVVSTEYGREILQYEVDPSTVGQYTGLADKDGKRIFEGDICEDARGFRFAVAWDEDNARFLGRGYGKRQEYIRYVGQEPAVMVIGTIRDNPELLEVSHV